MFRSETLRDNTSPSESVTHTLPVCAEATAGSPHPVRPFDMGIVESHNLSYDEVLAWRNAWCAYRNAYNHEEPAVRVEELEINTRNAPYHVQHQRMAGKYAEKMGNYHKAHDSERASNPMNLTDVALRDFTIATAKDDTTGILRAFEYAGWDVKE